MPESTAPRTPLVAATVSMTQAECLLIAASIELVHALLSSDYKGSTDALAQIRRLAAASGFTSERLTYLMRAYLTASDAFGGAVISTRFPS